MVTRFRRPEDDSIDGLRRVTRLNEDTYVAFAPAKLNLGGIKIGQIVEGYHHISTVMQTVSLADHVLLKKVKRGDEGVYSSILEGNIVEKALEEFFREIGERFYCKVIIQKNIPIAAGMAGGSSDAAAVLRLANVAFETGRGPRELEWIAERVGNDVPFLIQGGRAQIRGARRHEITPLGMSTLYYLIATPNMELSTKRMYKLHDETGFDFTTLARNLCADTDRLIPDIRIGAEEYGVTGKGPTVYAAFTKMSELEEAKRRISSWFTGRIFVARTLPTLDP